MARVKICPKCGAENSPSSSFCINENCGWDISGIKSMDREALARQREAAGAAPAAEPRDSGIPEVSGSGSGPGGARLSGKRRPRGQGLREDLP